MDTLFEGHIEKSVTMEDLLARVLEAQPAGLSFLRVSSTDKKVDGRVYFHNGSRIVGASLLDSPLSGYEALREVLSISVGSFALIVVGHGDRLAGDTNLSIDVSSLLGKLDRLPNQLSELFDQESLLNKVFSAKTTEPGQGDGNGHQNDNGVTPMGFEGQVAVDVPSSFKIGEFVQEAEMTNELHELVNQRLVKPPVEVKASATSQLRSLSKNGRVETVKGVRNALFMGCTIIALVLGAAVLWKQFGSGAPKKFLSSPIRSHPEVSSNRVHPANSGTYSRRTEGKALDAKQRTQNQRRRL